MEFHQHTDRSGTEGGWRTHQGRQVKFGRAGPELRQWEFFFQVGHAPPSVILDMSCQHMTGMLLGDYILLTTSERTGRWSRTFRGEGILKIGVKSYTLPDILVLAFFS